MTVGTENSADIEIYYEDHGSRQPVVLTHGYPLNGHSWERQERALLEAGCQVITYDRRGFGQSAKPASGFDYDKFAAIVKDRYGYFGDFFDNFYNTDTFAPDRISGRALEASFQVAVTASPFATYACVDTWLTDFRDDLPKIDVPTLVIHGTADRILPYEATAKRLRWSASRCEPFRHGPQGTWFGALAN